MKKLLCLLVTLCATIFVVTGCNTLEGAGEDIERGGEAIQEAAD